MYEYKARLKRVIDGDTLEMDIDLGFGIWYHGAIVRLKGINAPEKKGKTRYAAFAAMGFLETQLRSRVLIIQTEIENAKQETRGKFGRIIAELCVYEAGDTHRSINKLMVRAGHAVPADY